MVQNEWLQANSEGKVCSQNRWRKKKIIIKFNLRNGTKWKTCQANQIIEWISRLWIIKINRSKNSWHIVLVKGKRNGIKIKREKKNRQISRIEVNKESKKLFGRTQALKSKERKQRRQERYVHGWEEFKLWWKVKKGYIIEW